MKQKNNMPLLMHLFPEPENILKSYFLMAAVN